MLCEYQTDNNKPENDTNIKLLYAYNNIVGCL